MTLKIGRCRIKISLTWCAWLVGIEWMRSLRRVSGVVIIPGYLRFALGPLGVNCRYIPANVIKLRGKDYDKEVSDG